MHPAAERLVHTHNGCLVSTGTTRFEYDCVLLYWAQHKNTRQERSRHISYSLSNTFLSLGLLPL